VKDIVQVVTDWQQPMYNLAYRILGNEADAEDATQEIFVTLLRNLPQYDSTRPFKPWLYKLAINVMLKYIRGKKLYREKEKAAAMSKEQSGQQDEIELEEQQALIQREVALLPADLRSTVALHYYQGLTQMEIADVLGIPRPTIHSRLQKALDTMKGSLKQLGVFAVIPNVEGLMQSTPSLLVPSKLSASLVSMATQAAATTMTIGGIIMTKNIITAAVMLSIVSIATGLGIGNIMNHNKVYQDFFMETDKSMIEVATLKSDFQQMRAEHTSLEQKYNNLDESYQTIFSERTELQESFILQQKETAKLGNQLNEKNQEISSLQQEIKLARDPNSNKSQKEKVENWLKGPLSVMQELQKPDANKTQLGMKLVGELSRLSKDQYEEIFEYSKVETDLGMQDSIAWIMIFALNFNTEVVKDIRKPFMEGLLDRLKTQNGHSEEFQKDILMQISISQPGYEPYKNIVEPLSKDVKKKYLEYALQIAANSVDEHELSGAIQYLGRTVNPEAMPVLKLKFEDWKNSQELRINALKGIAAQVNTDTFEYLRYFEFKTDKELNPKLFEMIKFYIQSIEKQLKKQENQE